MFRTDCVFCRIVRREAPARILYEDDMVVAFEDARPQAPVHFLVVPKSHYATLLDVPDEGAGALWARIHQAIRKTAAGLGLHEKGFRVVVNCGRGAGQTVFHLHVHVVGGRFMRWPPG